LREDAAKARQKTDDAVDPLSVEDPLAGADGVAGQFDALADTAAVAEGFGDRGGGHDRWLQVAVDP
jgi:hypothetical protein